MSTLAPQTEIKALQVLAQCLPYFDELANLAMTSEDAFSARQAENLIRCIIEYGEGNYSGRVVSAPASTDSLYVLVLWPEVQELMEYEWFRPECYLHQAFDDQEYHDSAYFVPLDRMMDINEPG